MTTDSNTIQTKTDKNVTAIIPSAPSTKTSVKSTAKSPVSAITKKPAQLKAQNNKSITVYVTKSGKKYHVSGCEYLKKSCIPISLSQAKAEGYTTCSKCNPPQ